MTNVQYNATHPGHSNQFSGVQNLSTATNDTRLCSETPKPTMAGDNEVISKVFFSPYNSSVLKRFPNYLSALE